MLRFLEKRAFGGFKSKYLLLETRVLEVMTKIANAMRLRFADTTLPDLLGIPSLRHPVRASAIQNSSLKTLAF